MNDEIKKKIETGLKRKEEAELRLKEHWNNLPKFNTIHDIPDIPIVNKEEYHGFYVSRLIAAGAIPKEELKDGQAYIGKHRRCDIARWNKSLNKFEYWREKFGTKFIDTCNHFEDDDGFALFVPILEADQKAFEINNNN